MEPVLIVHNAARHRYETSLPGGDWAFISYTMEGEKKALRHTIVPQAHEGKGIAAALAKYVLEEARAAGEKVVPYCPYVQTYLKRHPEYADVAEAVE